LISTDSRWAAGLVVLLAACAAPLSPGEIGTARYFGEVEGEVPLRLLPPKTDREGNVYILYGETEWTDTTVFVGHANGGWSGGCRAHRGSYPVHGFSGSTEDRSWYWSGDALVEVDGNTGSCEEVLSTDPVTGAALQYRAVVPWIHETVSRSTMLVLVQSATDDLPFHAVVDVDQHLYGDLRPFQPDNAENLVVIGVGSNVAKGRGYIAVQYLDAGSTVNEILVLEAEGNTLFRVPIDAGEELEAHALEGGMRVTSNGLGAGVLTDGRVLIFDEGSSEIVTPNDMEAVGVQLRDDALWLTGQSSGVPKLARISDGKILTSALDWPSSTSLISRISSGLVVADERTDPTRKTHWSEVSSAIGAGGLLSPHALDPHTFDTTGWLFAGPYYVANDLVITAVAFAPVGVSFP